MAREGSPPGDAYGGQWRSRAERSAARRWAQAAADLRLAEARTEAALLKAKLEVKPDTFLDGLASSEFLSGGDLELADRLLAAVTCL